MSTQALNSKTIQHGLKDIHLLRKPDCGYRKVEREPLIKANGRKWVGVGHVGLKSLLRRLK
jgi:hypothetical protein